MHWDVDAIALRRMLNIPWSANGTSRGNSPSDRAFPRLRGKLSTVESGVRQKVLDLRTVQRLTDGDSNSLIPSWPDAAGIGPPFHPDRHNIRLEVVILRSRRPAQ
jgi:hypothetical protein